MLWRFWLSWLLGGLGIDRLVALIGDPFPRSCGSRGNFLATMCVGKKGNFLTATCAGCRAVGGGAGSAVPDVRGMGSAVPGTVRTNRRGHPARETARVSALHFGRPGCHVASLRGTIGEGGTGQVLGLGRNH